MQALFILERQTPMRHAIWYLLRQFDILRQEVRQISRCSRASHAGFRGRPQGGCFFALILINCRTSSSQLHSQVYLNVGAAGDITSSPAHPEEEEDPM